MIKPRGEPDSELLPAVAWERALRDAVAPDGWLPHVVETTPSTQDIAWELSRTAPAQRLMVVAKRQTAGRGRLGRAWVDERDKGLAATFVIPVADAEPGLLPLAAGLAAADACDAILRRGGCMIRWPNDVVEGAGDRPRKLAGVLIERRDDVFLIGIGINVLHTPADFPEALSPHATSLVQLAQAGAEQPRVDPRRLTTAISLALALHARLRQPGDVIAQAWKRRDVLRGREATFVCDGVERRGVVEAVDPAAAIVLRTGDGSLITLPAATTSLVHHAPALLRARRAAAHSHPESNAATNAR
ncbi:MAG: biotin--[acetyl-CoA-carboxylase] ligase [Planctomycetota bacterium]|nr:biotin--[acetyl-CoA-carboxylase] ligase [Planctomycetota bacterium]